MTEPVTVSTAKLWLRVDHDADDDVIEDLIAEARRWFEIQTGLVVVERTEIERFDAFPEIIEPQWRPVKSITTIQYYDSAGTLQTLDSSYYQLDVGGSWDSARIALEPDQSWPSTESGRQNAVIVTYVAGLDSTDDADDIAIIARAIQLKVAELYEQRVNGEVAALATGKMTQLRQIVGQYGGPYA